MTNFRGTHRSLRTPRRQGEPVPVWSLVALTLLGLGAISSVGLVSAVHAATDLSGWCPSADLSGNICTISTGAAEISSNVTISFGETLAITGSGSLSVDLFVTLTINSGGNLFIDNTAVGSIGFSNSGTVANHGSITVENSGGGSHGIDCYGTLTNHGSITVENNGTNSYGIVSTGSTFSGGNFTNVGTIVVQNSGDGSAGLVTFSGSITTLTGSGTITNSGSVTVKNTGTSSGISNGAFFYNSGTMTIENAASGSVGIFNEPGGNFYNWGTITIQNSGTGTYGVYNQVFAYPGSLPSDGTIFNECSGRIDIANTGGVGLDNNATIYNYGTLTGTVTEEPGGVLIDDSASCGGTTTTTTTTASTTTATTTTTSATSTTSSVTSTTTQADSDSSTLQTDLQGNFSRIFFSFSQLQKDLQLNFSGLSSGLGLLQSDVKGNFSAISGGPLFNGATDSLHAISSSLTGLSDSVSAQLGSITGEGFSSASDSLHGISTALSNGFGGISAALGTFNPGDTVAGLLYGMQTSISDGFSQLSSEISSMGSTGPLAASSDSTTVASVSLKSLSAPSSIGISPSDWTQIATAPSDQAVIGYTVSTTKGSISQGVLYVTFTNSQCGCTPGTFAIPIGDIPNGVTPFGGVTSPHFSIPAGSTVYVQLVSSSKAGADVQLQFVGLPISGPTIVGTG